jgi:hypothetical protein
MPKPPGEPEKVAARASNPIPDRVCPAKAPTNIPALVIEYQPIDRFREQNCGTRSALEGGTAMEINFRAGVVFCATQQKYIFLADGANEKIYVMLPNTLEILTSFGDGGRQPGQFTPCIASPLIRKVTTYRSQRVQKFVYNGLAAVTKKDQGVV